MSTTEPAVRRRAGRTRTREEVSVTRTLDRGLAILEVVAEGVQMTLSEIARACEMSPSTAFRLIETLERRGFLAKAGDGSGHVRIGARAFEIGMAFAAGGRLKDLARPIMRGLAEDCGETVLLGVRDASHAVCIEEVEGRSPVRVGSRLGARLPLHCTAVGKVLLAWLWERRIDEIVGSPPYARSAAHTITEREALLADLAQVRQRGHALDDQEFQAEAGSLAAPIRDRGGEVVASLAVAAPSARLTAVQTEVLAAAVLAAAAAVSERLGWKSAAAAPVENDPGASMLFED